MPKERVRLRFEGPALDDHKIDVDVLSVCLRGIGDSVREANALLNGKDVKSRVFIHADIEANCVTFDFSVIQSLYDSLLTILGNNEVKTTKEILEWIGLVGSGGVGVGVIKLLQWLVKNKTPGSSLETIEDEKGMVVIKVRGNNNQITVRQEVYKLASDEQIVKGLLKVLSPLKEEGIESATIVHNDESLVVQKQDILPVLTSRPIDLDMTVSPQFIEGHIVVHAPVFDNTVKRWKFKWNGRVESIVIENTSIAKIIDDQGGVRIGDAFKVKMELIEKKTKSGFKHHLRVLEVIEFIPSRSDKQFNLGMNMTLTLNDTEEIKRENEL